MLKKVFSRKLALALIIGALSVLGGFIVLRAQQRPKNVSEINTKQEVYLTGTIDSIENGKLTFTSGFSTFDVYVYDSTYLAVDAELNETYNLVGGYKNQSTVNVYQALEVGNMISVKGYKDGETTITANRIVLLSK